MDKFHLSYNPNNPNSNERYIIHLLEPIAIIECIKSNNIQSINFCYLFLFQNEEWILRLHYCSSDDDKEIDKLINRAWRWYRAYLTQDKYEL